MTTPAVVLPKIGSAARNALVKLTGAALFDPEWNQLSQVRVNGYGMTGNMAAAVTAASMSYSSVQAGQMTLTFQDDEVGSILWANLLRRWATIDFGDQHLMIMGLDIGAGSGGATITVRCRSRVVNALNTKPHVGLGSWGELDVTRWVLDRCAEAGAHPVVQPGLGKLLFTRTAKDDTTWAMMQRAATAVGGWCFECENTITFGRPTYLAAKSRARWWPLTYNDTDDYTTGLTGLPTYSWSNEQAESLAFGLLSGDAATIRPGHGVTLAGRVGPAVGQWVVVQVDLPLTTTQPVQVTCSRIVNPEPQQVG